MQFNTQTTARKNSTHLWMLENLNFFFQLAEKKTKT